MVSMLLAATAMAPRPIVLADRAKTAYTIVVAKGAPEPTRYAAAELKSFLGQVTGAEFPIVDDDSPARAKEILVGRSRRTGTFAVDWKKLGMDDHRIVVRGDKLLLAGGEPRGSLYAVYTFLENHVGCRWYTPDVAKIPKQARLSVPAVDETHSPVLESREPFVWEAFNGDWAARNKANGDRPNFEPRHGGGMKFGSGFFVHTFNRLLPGTYFDAHPEYFSMIDGQRIRDGGQLCCTNPDVVKIVGDNLLQAMREQPNATVFSVSQNDWYNPCQCDKCQALATEEGSQIAPVLQMVNQVADRVAAEFPDKVVETLAYQWTRQAPKTMRPRPNVIIRLCTIECCFSHPLETCDSPQNQAFRKDIEAWAKVADRLWVWNYVTSFPHYLIPFPNLHVRQDNIRFFVKNHVKGLFEQDVYTTPNGELSTLSGYLGAKLLWNPEADAEAIMQEFLREVYGPAAKPIREYIRLLADKVVKENLHMGCWAGPQEGYLTNDVLIRSNQLWDQAERAVAKNDVARKQVETARLSVDYATLERRKANVAGPYGMFETVEGVRRPHPDYVALLDRFEARCKAAGILMLNEPGLQVADYVGRLRQALEAAAAPHLAMGKPVEANPPSPKYPGGGPVGLTDGSLASVEAGDPFWLGYENEPFRATVDLGSLMEVSEVSVDFLDNTGSWIFLPAKLEFSLSPDGEDFESVFTRTDDSPAGHRPAKVHRWTGKFESRPARFVRVDAQGVGVCPDWHVGAGRPAWLFVDEIVVR